MSDEKVPSKRSLAQPLRGEAAHAEQCTICNSPLKAEVEAFMIGPGKYSPAEVSRKYNFNTEILTRHFAACSDRLNTERSRMILKSAEELLARTLVRIDTLWGWAERALESGNMKEAGQLAEVARRYQEMASRYQQVPGYREQVQQNLILPGGGNNIMITSQREGPPALPVPEAPSQPKLLGPGPS